MPSPLAVLILSSRPKVCHLTLLLFSVLALPFYVSRVSAQTTPDTDEIINVRTNLVTVPVVVTDRRGDFVSGLVSTDFEVYDADRVVPVEVLTVGVEELAIAFVIDASGSTRDHIAQQERATQSFIERFPRPPRSAVIHFDVRPEVVLPFTTDVPAVRRAFNVGVRRGSRTAVFDAALAAVRYFDDLGANNLERRVVVLISDGLDTASTTLPSAVVNEANLRGVAIYVVHLPLYTPREGRLVPRQASRGFRELGSRTGGKYYRIGDAKMSLDPRASYDFAPVFDDIVKALRGQYVLGFYPPAPHTLGRGEYETSSSVVARSIAVKLRRRDRRDLRVRALRESYLAPRPAAHP